MEAINRGPFPIFNFRLPILKANPSNSPRLCGGCNAGHAFTKKTHKTPLQEITLAQKRLKELLDEEG